MAERKVMIRGRSPRLQKMTGELAKDEVDKLMKVLSVEEYWGR